MPTTTHTLRCSNDEPDGIGVASSAGVGAKQVDSVNDSVGMQRHATVLKPAGLSMKANFSWTFIGNLVNTGALFLSTVVLAKVGTPENVGEFAMALALTTPIFMFATLKLREVQATDAKQEYSFGDYFGLRLLTTVVAIVVCLVIAGTTNDRIGMFAIVLATTCYKSVEAVSDSLYGLFMQQERLDRVAKSMIFKGPLSLVGLVIGFVVFKSVFWAIIGMTVGRLVILLLYDFRNVTGSFNVATNSVKQMLGLQIPRPRWDVPTLRRLTWLTLPLGLVTLFVSLNANVPRYLIEYHFGDYQLGLFAAVASFQRTAPTIVQALGRSASPRLAKYFASGNLNAFVKLSIKLVLLGMALCAGGVFVAAVAGHQIIVALYGPEYDVAGLFEWIMWAAGLEYIASMLTVVITSARYYRVQLPLQVATVMATALLCVWLVPSLGLVGAAIALAMGNLVRVAGCALLALAARRSLVKRRSESSESIAYSLAAEGGNA